MHLRHVGFFKELQYGPHDGPNLLESIRRVAKADEDKMVRYLNGGHIMIASPGVVEDVIEPGKMIATPSVLTDGLWAWPEDLAYYVAMYHVELPEEFVSHMRQRKWEPPRPDEVVLEELEL